VSPALLEDSVRKRFGIILVAVLALAAPYAPIACAAELPLSKPPTPDAELVRREVATGAFAARTVLSTIQSVRVGKTAAVVTVAGDAGPHSITVDYSEVARDRKATGAGYLAGAYLGLGAVARLARTFRRAFGALR